MSEEINFQNENDFEHFFVEHREEVDSFLDSQEDLTGNTQADTTGSTHKKAPFKIEKVS